MNPLSVTGLDAVARWYADHPQMHPPLTVDRYAVDVFDDYEIDTMPLVVVTTLWSYVITSDTLDHMDEETFCLFERVFDSTSEEDVSVAMFNIMVYASKCPLIFEIFELFSPNDRAFLALIGALVRSQVNMACPVIPYAVPPRLVRELSEA